MNTRNLLATILAITVLSTLTACGGKRTQVVTWWVLPDRVGAEDLAQNCSDIADGYRIEVRELPPTLDDRRADLVRRLSAGDDDLDLLTLDTSLTAEFASAKFLATPPADLTATSGLVPTAVAGASHEGKVVAVPWWIDPQLLWYRGAAAERAGINVERPVSWNNLLAGADRVRASVQLDNADGTGLTDWVRALVAEAGGEVVRGTGRMPKTDLGGAPGRAAAGIVQYYAASGLGSGPTTNAPSEFAGSRGAFLVARASVRSLPAIAQVAPDMKPLPYPTVNGVSSAPVAGASLAVPKSSDQQKSAFDAVRCLSNAGSERKLMINAGVGAAREGVYSHPDVTKALPFANVILEAASKGLNVPPTPYWHNAERALRATWTPLSAVRPKTTPEKSATAVLDAVGGGLK